MMDIIAGLDGRWLLSLLIERHPMRRLDVYIYNILPSLFARKSSFVTVFETRGPSRTDYR